MPRINLTGQKVRDWEVVEYSHKGCWKCVCSKGHTAIKSSTNIKSGKLEVCSKCFLESKCESCIGKTFGNWTVISYTRKTKLYFYFLCKCKCGIEKEVAYSCFTKGTSKRCRSCAMSAPRGAVAITGLYSNYKRDAYKRGLVWNLSMDFFEKITKQDCHYTGLPPSSIHKTASGSIYVYNGIDRIDSSKGYTEDNVLPCNSKINRMKFNYEYSDFIELCSLVTKNITEKRKELLSENKLKAV